MQIDSLSLSSDLLNCCQHFLDTWTFYSAQWEGRSIYYLTTELFDSYLEGPYSLSYFLRRRFDSNSKRQCLTSASNSRTRESPFEWWLVCMSTAGRSQWCWRWNQLLCYTIQERMERYSPINQHLTWRKVELLVRQWLSKACSYDSNRSLGSAAWEPSSSEFLLWKMQCREFHTW